MTKIFFSLHSFLSGFLILFFCSTALTQTINGEEQPSENWLNQYTGYSDPYMYHRFDRYSKEDLIKFREKFDLLKNFETDGDWEGLYFDDLSPLGFSQFRWKHDSGFLSFYIYTCLPELRSINYGNVAVSPDYIQLLPEFADNSPRKVSPVKFIKVRWNDRKYLVEESSLPFFAEKAAGIYVEPDEDSEENAFSWTNYWVKGDLEKELTGLPEFPAAYKKYEHKPINAKISSIISRKIENEFESGNTYYADKVAVYEIRIDAGKKQGIKKGLKFIGDKLNGEIFITQVSRESSVGLIVRHLGDNDSEECWNDENKVVCSKIVTGLKISTVIGAFHY